MGSLLNVNPLNRLDSEIFSIKVADKQADTPQTRRLTIGSLNASSARAKNFGMRVLFRWRDILTWSG